MHGDYNAKLVEMLPIDAAIYIFGVEFVFNFRMAAGSLIEFPRRLRCYFFYVAVSFANMVPREVSPYVKHRLTEEGLSSNTSSVRARHTPEYISLWTKLKAMLTYAVSKAIFLFWSRFDVPTNNIFYHRLQSQP
jgi:hypothetical protein